MWNSGGEKQKISIINSLLKNGELLILDEPSSALDKNSTIYLQKELVKLKSQKIIIIISHMLLRSGFAIPVYSYNLGIC